MVQKGLNMVYTCSVKYYNDPKRSDTLCMYYNHSKVLASLFNHLVLCSECWDRMANSVYPGKEQSDHTLCPIIYVV